MNSIFKLDKLYQGKVLAFMAALIFLLATIGIISTYHSFIQTSKELVGWLFPPAQTTTTIENVVIGGLQEMDVLATEEISNKSTIKKTKSRNISRLVIGRTNLIYEGIGTVEAGINLESIKIRENKKERKIYVDLPSAHLTKIYLNINKSRVVDSYKKGLGENVEQTLLEQAQQEALAAIKAEACSTDIIRKANKQAKQLVENLTDEFDNVVVNVSKANSCRLKA